MRAVVIQNPHAGLQPPPTDKVFALLQKTGFEILSIQSISTQVLEKALRNKADLIVLIGGDGTVRHFIKHFAPIQTPILIIPTGTSNNIARSLQLPDLPVTIQLNGKSSLVPFYPGKVSTSGVNNFFLESIGAGMIARMMGLMHFRKFADPYFYDYQQEKYEESLHLLRAIIHSQSPQHCRLIIDGEDYSAAYLFVEIMNIPMIGPNLKLASKANPGDDYLEVVWLRPEDRHLFEQQLIRRLEGKSYSLELPARHCRKAELTWEGADVHMDGEAFKDYDNRTLQIETSRDQLNFYKGA